LLRFPPVGESHVTGELSSLLQVCGQVDVWANQISSGKSKKNC